MAICRFYSHPTRRGQRRRALYVHNTYLTRTSLYIILFMVHYRCIGYNYSRTLQYSRSIIYILHVVVVVVVFQKVERQIGKSNYSCALLLPARRPRKRPFVTLSHTPIHAIYTTYIILIYIQVYTIYRTALQQVPTYISSSNFGLYPSRSHPAQHQSRHDILYRYPVYYIVPTRKHNINYYIKQLYHYTISFVRCVFFPHDIIQVPIIMVIIINSLIRYI